ncbi:tryptophan transporter [Ureibacillus aquaedulcis]|uniref:Tryptophan transporter n=1 Tax=Ureibacillus aquaedulcis TaxID=3058421 RepID=A0ABT8GUR8_9BACL|nr:tryptophan transporter [Ureibacillus sp. BA0131]MDN4495091.1 hypothetical protein [Ureibacillus sp. BA0131]
MVIFDIIKGYHLGKEQIFIKLRHILFLIVLMGVGFGLDAIIGRNTFYPFIPRILYNSEPDILVVMMCIGIILFPNTKNVIVLSLISGFLSIFTNDLQMTVGYVASFMSKPITAFIVYGALFLFKKKDSFFVGIFLITIGTCVSVGTFHFLSGIFLKDILFLIGGILYLISVTIFNIIFACILYPIAKAIKKHLLST